MLRRAPLWLVFLCASSPATALAFDEAPLCAFRSEASLSSALDPELECAPQTPLRLPEPLWTAPISTAEARRALAHADELIHDSRLSDALLELRVAERAMPRVRDRIALRRAGVLMRLGRPADACDAYALAEASPDRNVAAEARIGMVRCLLEAGVRSGEGELERIVQRYPRMGDRADLRFALAQARRSWGDTAGAVAIYRSIDLDEPESRVAAGARSALAEIAATGFNVHPYTPNDVVDRAERLVKRGSVESGHEAVEQLLATQNLPQLQAGRTQLLAARIARIEGRWDDVRTAVEMAMTLGVPAAEAQRLLPRGTLPVADADPSTLRADGETQLKHLFVGRPTQKIQTPQLRAALEIAVRYGLKDSATAIVGTLRDRTSVPAAARFEAAMLAFGVASDEAIANLLATVESTAAYRVAARYHHGRALERMGRYGEAEADYLWVLSEDRRDPRYYAMWADLRLWAMRSERAQTCMVDDRGAPDLVTAALEALPQEAPTSMAAETLPPDAASDAHAAPAPGAALAALTSQEPTTAEAAADPEAENNARRARLLPKLSGVAELYGEAYPWLARAADLVALDLFEDAADEVGEAYLAWRDARGDLRLRSGLEAVLTGDAPARHVADNALRKARLSLDADARGALAAVAGELGDPGVSLRFAETRGEMRGEVRPRAYSDDVEHAATKYALDPNLLFAVMRVESIYHRQIVSYAGAVGLMQIMPRTGMLIARKLGVEDFDVSDLLNPRTNVEFAAWYLSSLLKRFDGRLPLAIAAYNGGPHNVRLWMREGNPDMPLDAFLERIPFDQTHRYVRRVLTHYAAYRAQQNLPMTRLDIALPAPQPDTMAF